MDDDEEGLETLTLRRVPTRALDALDDMAKAHRLDLEALLRRIIVAAARIDWHQRADGSRGAVTVGTAVHEFTFAHSDLSAALRWSASEQRVARLWGWRFAHAVGSDTPLEDITPTVVRAFFAGPGVRETPMVGRCLALLASFFDWCVERGYLGGSPMRGVDAAGKDFYHPVIGSRARKARWERERRESEEQRRQRQARPDDPPSS